MIEEPTIAAEPPEHAPDRNQPATFSDRADAWVAWIRTAFYPYLKAALTYVSAALTTILAARDATLVAAAATDATEWVSGGSYTSGNVRWSPADGGTYRAKTDHSGLTTDPSLDPINWTGIHVANTQTTPDDDTPGRILTVGAGGMLGGNALSWLGSGFDLDNPPMDGVVAAINNTTVNGPGGQGTIWSARRAANELVQLVLKRDSELWARAQDSGTFGDWRRFYNTLNILGEVTESSGIPTGALIKRTVNAQGRFVRFADGLQICVMKRTGPTSETTLTFPSVFAEIDSYSASYNPNSTTNTVDVVVSFAEPTLSTIKAGLYDISSGGLLSSVPSTSTLTVTAFGRWY